MALSEFKWNKKRQHYSYLFKQVGDYRKNILLSTKPKVINKKKNKESNNIKLYKHPNPNSNKDVYVVPKIYLDHYSSFDNRTYNWNFHNFDKRNIKKIKKGKIKQKFISIK